MQQGNGVEITDTGMSDANIELALSPFGQLDSALNRDHTVTGLGLPLSRSLAELHAGSLRIESNPGSGTSVTAYLPAKRPSSSEPPPQLVMGGQDG